MFARAFAVVVLAVVLLAAAAAGPASATPVPAYKMYASLSAGPHGHVEGYALDAATFAASPDTIRVDVARAGDVIATATGTLPGYAQIPSVVLAPGDEVTVTDETTGDAHTVTYSGQPALDVSALCGAGGAKFSGTRDEGTDVSVGALSASGAIAAVKVATGAGTTFAGGFTKSLSSAWTVTAQETITKSDAFSAYADVSAAGLDCPTPPVVADPPPVASAAPPVVTPPAPAASAPPAAGKDVVAPLASLTVRVARAWRALVGGTFSDAVTVTEPGTVRQVLYADAGAKATVLGSGGAVVSRAGKVTVKLKLSNKGKAHVKARKAVKVKLVTTVVDRAGNARVLAPKRFTVKRGR